MDKIVLASNNAHKVAELQAFMRDVYPGVTVLSLRDIGYTAEIVEDGDTFEDNALIKARTIAALGYTAIADDSGLMVDALDGAPGVYSARYAGEPCDNAANNEKLLSELRDVPDEKRTAKFVSVIAMVTPDGSEIIARGECRGTILREYRGNGGFGYDPLFFYEPYGRTFAELTPDEKNRISHRAAAIADLKVRLSQAERK